MATLPSGSSVSISFLDIYNNINSTSGTPVASIGLKDLSETLADGSIVNPLTTSKRAALRAAPYAIDEVWGADYPSSILSNMTIKRGGSTETQFVDGETLQVGYDITADWDPDPYDSGDSIDNIIQIIDSSDNVDLSGTNTITDSAPSGTQTKSFSSLALTAGIYEVKIILDSSNTFNQIVNSSAFTHYDQLENGSTSITNGTQYVDAEDESVTNVVLTPTVNTGVQASTSIGTTVLTGGDGGNISVTNTTGTTYSVQNTPGNLRFNIIHIGNPSQARNNTTSTATVDIRYTNAIDSITQSQGNVNVSAYDGSNNATFTCYSEGYSGTLTIGYDDSATASDTSYTNTTEPVSTLYVREYIDKDLTISSAGTYYPKAHHDGNAVVGSSFIVAPLLTYTTTNNQTIDVDATQVMAASVTAGTNTQVAIASSPSLQTGNTSVTFSPGTDNGVYTISYTGTANYSQVNNQTDLLTVRPKVELGRSTATVYGIGSYTSGYTPTGVTSTNVTITTEVDGTAPTYNWTKPSGTTVSGGGSGDPTVTMNFSGASGTKTFSATVTGRAVGSTNTTSTSDSIDVTYTIFTQQSISGVGPTSGDFRRGATSLPVTWTSINVAFVDVDLLGNSSGTTGTVSFVTDNDSLDVANTSEPQAYSAATPDVGFSKVGTYNVRVRDASDNLPSTTTNTEVQKINILDTAPVTPGAFQDTAGGYNGSLVMDWAVGGYRYQYELEKSDGDSNGSYNTTLATQTGTSYTLNEASSTSTYGPFYYRVRAKNFAQGGLTTEYSNYNTARRFIIYPTLDANNNIPQPNVSTIYSTTQNSTTTSTVMNVTSDSDNVTGYSWATSLTTGASISNAAVQNPTITAGSGVGTITTALTVTGNANAQQHTHSTDNITVNYYPKIYDITFTGGTIITETTDLYIQSIVWQGFQSAGFIARVYTASGGGGSEVGENEPAINDLGGITFQTNCIDNDIGGTQKTSTAWIHNSAANIGVISGTGTLYLRVVDAGGSYAYEESFTVTDYTTLEIIGFTLLGSSSGFANQEDAAVGSVTGGSLYSVDVFYLGTIGSGTITVLSAKGGGAYNGGNKWWDLPGGRIGYIESDGEITAANYITDGNAQPKAPDQLGLAAQTNATQINITWRDNSAIEDGYLIYQSTSGTATNSDPEIADLSAGTTSFNKTGLSAGTTHYYAIYADNGTGRSTVLQGSQQTQLVDATTVNITSNQNGQGAITVSGNQSGLSGGVTFGLVSSSADTTFLGSDDKANDATDTRYTLHAYTDAFTPDDPYGNTVTQYIKGRVIDPNDGGGTNKNTTSTITVYPTLTTSKNTIAPGRSTIYSDVQANDTSTYPPTVSYGTPGTPTDNVSSYLYSAGTSLTGHGFSDDDAATTTYGGGSGIGSSLTSLRIRGTGASGTQETTTTHTVTVNYEPRIYSISYTGGTITENSTTFKITQISWQGHNVTSFAGFQVAVYTTSGGSTEVSTLGALNINGATLTDGTPSGATGTTQTRLTWTGGGGVSLGTITANGTLWIRVSDNTGTMTPFEESFAVVGWGNVSANGYVHLIGQHRAWDTQEEAVGASIPGSAVGPFSDTLYYLGTLGSTDPIEFKTSSGGSAFNGGNYWWDLAGGYIGRINSSGQMTAANYIADAQAQPIAPTLNAFSGITTSQIVINWNDNSGIEDNYYLYQDDSSAASISNYDNVYTIAQNVETYSNTSLTTNTPSTSLTATAHPTINGRIDLSWSVSGHTSFVVYEGTSWPPSTSIATSGTSATRTGLADSQIYYYSINAQGSGKTYYYGLYAKNGNTLSSIAQGSSATTAGAHTTYDNATTIAAADPVWGSQPSIGTIGGLENQTRYRPISNPSSFTITITNADTDANQVTAAISNIQGSHQYTELSCIVSTGTIANSASWPNEGVTSTTTADGSSDTIHFRFRIDSNRDAPQGSQSGTLTFTLSNGGVDSTFTNVAWEVGEPD